jgi:mono/diheme cytochrome c family protein
MHLTLSLVTCHALAQDNKATPRERAGAVTFGQHCSACHGVRLMKEDAAFDLVNFVNSTNNVDEARFIRGAKTARGMMPSFARTLSDQELADVYAYVKRGHTPDLNDVPMESNH